MAELRGRFLFSREKEETVFAEDLFAADLPEFVLSKGVRKSFDLGEAHIPHIGDTFTYVGRTLSLLKYLVLKRPVTKYFNLIHRHSSINASYTSN